MAGDIERHSALWLLPILCFQENSIEDARLNTHVKRRKSGFWCEHVILQDYHQNRKNDLFLIAFSVLGLPNVENTLTDKEDFTKLFSQFLCTESMTEWWWSLMPEYKQQLPSNQVASRLVIVRTVS